MCNLHRYQLPFSIKISHPSAKLKKSLPKCMLSSISSNVGTCDRIIVCARRWCTSLGSTRYRPSCVHPRANDRRRRAHTHTHIVQSAGMLLLLLLRVRSVKVKFRSFGHRMSLTNMCMLMVLVRMGRVIEQRQTYILAVCQVPQRLAVRGCVITNVHAYTNSISHRRQHQEAQKFEHINIRRNARNGSRFSNAGNFTSRPKWIKYKQHAEKQNTVIPFIGFFFDWRLFYLTSGTFASTVTFRFGDLIGNFESVIQSLFRFVLPVSFFVFEWVICGFYYCCCSRKKNSCYSVADTQKVWSFIFSSCLLRVSGLTEIVCMAGNTTNRDNDRCLIEFWWSCVGFFELN